MGLSKGLLASWIHVEAPHRFSQSDKRSAKMSPIATSLFNRYKRTYEKDALPPDTQDPGRETDSAGENHPEEGFITMSG